jgi:hypothetical protein
MTIFFSLHPSEPMTHHKRILGIVLCGFLAWGTNAWAAGKHKAGGHGKSSTRPSTQSRDIPGANGAADGASAKEGSGQADARSGNSHPPLRESVRQESRIEFDERMLRGQSAAGVIYLFQRTPSDWKSIVEVPDSFRARTVNVVAPVQEKK